MAAPARGPVGMVEGPVVAGDELTGVEGPVPLRMEGELPECIATMPANPAALATTTAGARLILCSSFAVVVWPRANRSRSFTGNRPRSGPSPSGPRAARRSRLPD